MNAEKRQQIFERLRDANPHPTTELNWTTPFELLVAVVLSAQATDVGVNKATARLFAEANTPQAIVELGVDSVTEHIRTINFHRNKAKNIVRASELLIEKHDGEIPHTREELEALPGVGRKTANVILNTAFGEPTMAVDTHIFRVSNRTHLAPGKNVDEVEQALLRLVPQEFQRNAHHWLLLHGRYTCVARKPKCAGCIINDLCEYPDKTERS